MCDATEHGSRTASSILGYGVAIDEVNRFQEPRLVRAVPTAIAAIRNAFPIFVACLSVLPATAAASASPAFVPR